jgi:hypothetical protein
MSKANSWETALLSHLFTNAAVANVGDATGLPGAATAGNLYVSLHTADPGETGTQSTSEATYTGYARVAVARSSAGWTVGTGTVANAADINFPQCTAGTSTVTYIGIGTAASGAGTLLYSAAFNGSASIAVTSTSNAIVTVPAGSLVVNED